MRRRPLALVLTAALIGAVFTALPAKAATEVPATPNILDASGDANHHSFASGQGVGLTLNGADILAVWFTEDADNVYTHIQTTNNARPESLTFVVYADPSKGAECMQLRTTTGGNFNDPFASVNLTADCGTAGTTVVGEVTEEEGPDATSILTSKYPKADVPLLANGTTLKAPNALVGYNAQDATPRAGIIDDTAVGTDFSITGGGDVEPPVVEEPEEPKPAKNPCKKLKGKKKKKCLKKHAAKPCTAYTPGEKGAEAETSVVTDAATAEAPIEVPLTMDPSVGAFSGEVQGQANPLVSHAIQNVQVDTSSADSGLYVRVEFPEGEDYDLYLFDAEGNDAAHAGGGNQAPEELGDGTGNGGHSETTAEQLDGVKTADCGGYTVDVANAIGMGEATLKFWLGPATWDPAAQAPIESGSSKAFVF
jgi:hypothetical protein